MTHKLLDTLERDIRNQVLFDQMKKTPNRRTRLMLHFRDHKRAWLAIAAFAAAWTWALTTCVRADPAPQEASPGAVSKPQCPDPGVKCKILFLSEAEEHMLMGQNGILDTAAQARSLDLGQFAVYLKTRIAAAPAGEVKQPPEAAKPAEGNPALGAGPTNPAGEKK
jgi:hypothetical protein